MSLDVDKIRKDFPILSEEVNGKPLVYLDNAATTQLPLPVIRKIQEYYEKNHSNVHRGIHTLSERATTSIEDARDYVRNFLCCSSLPEEKGEVIFTSGATDAIDLAVRGLWSQIHPGDRIFVTQLEHHSNLLVWQRLCKYTGAELVMLPCPEGELDLSVFYKELSGGIKVLAVTQVSNLTGTVMPIKELADAAKRKGAWVLVDGAQGIRHSMEDVRESGCDFYCFSGHKIMGPTGTGVLWGRREALEQLESCRVGGGVVDQVWEDSYTLAELPYRLEAGTPNIAGAVGLHAALEYIDSIGRADIICYENDLVLHAQQCFQNILGLEILGKPDHRAGVLSLASKNIHSYDIASLLDKYGVAVRSGTHCAQPALASFGMSNALRISPAFYNTVGEIDYACMALQKTMEMLTKWAK